MPALGQSFANGDFGAGTLSGWTVANTSNGVGAPGSVAVIDIDGPGPLGPSNAARFQAGQATPQAGIQHGVTMTQNLSLVAGTTYVVDFDWSAQKFSGTNAADGGNFALIVGGTVIAQGSAGSTGVTLPRYGHVTGVFTQSVSGPVGVGVRVTRGFTPTADLFQYVDNVAISVAQSTAFTYQYQGRLRNGTALASGLHDFQFRLFGAPSGGSQLGPTACVNNVLVTGGEFTAALDFGQQYGATTPRFLEIEVRPDTGLDCTNGAGFVVLAPRTPLAPAPLASHAQGAFALDAPDGSPVNAVFVDNAGNVGVGTTTPQATLHVVASGEDVRIQGSNTGSANLAWIGFRDAAGTEIGSVGDARVDDTSMYLVADAGDVRLITAGGGLTAKAGGNVGIGTTTPAVKLDVRGDIRLGPSGQFRAVSGGENLRIIPGVINSDGSIISGTGFTVSHPGTGQYNVTFSTVFGSSPAVTATVMETVGSPNTAFAMLALPATASGVDLEVFERASGSFVNRVVHFIAVGPR